MKLHSPLRRAGLACVERSRPCPVIIPQFLPPTRQALPKDAAWPRLPHPRPRPSYRQSPSGKFRRKRKYRASLDNVFDRRTDQTSERITLTRFSVLRCKNKLVNY